MAVSLRMLTLRMKGQHSCGLGVDTGSYGPFVIEHMFDRVGRCLVYAELHCHTNFSFLDGASHPEDLVEQAVRLGYEALAVTDHDGFYGVSRFWQAAKASGLPAIYGVEIGLEINSGGVADPVTKAEGWDQQRYARVKGGARSSTTWSFGASSRDKAH